MNSKQSLWNSRVTNGTLTNNLQRHIYIITGPDESLSNDKTTANENTNDVRRELESHRDSWFKVLQDIDNSKDLDRMWRVRR